MKNRDLFTFAAGLQAVGDLRGVKFAYAVAKNFHLIQAEVEALRASAKPEEAFQPFDKERIALCVECAEKDEAGNAKVDGANFTIDVGKQTRFDEQLAALREEHAEAVARRKVQLLEYEVLLDEEADVSLHCIAEEHLPEEITAAQLTGIFDMIADGARDAHVGS